MDDTQKALPLVSIVIPMLNEVGAIGQCINSILALNYPRELVEIVIVDGLSQDGSREKVQELAAMHTNIKMYDNSNKRTPRSLNIGIHKSRGDIVIILGAHTRIKTDFVRLNVEYMNKMQVKCVGGTQINTGDTFVQQAIGVAMGSRFGIPSAPYRFYKKARFVDTVVYAAYSRELFDRIGYFDEKLHISEDAELNWRIRKAGYQIYYTPEIVSYYYPRKNLVRLGKQFFNYGILRVNVIKKHPDAVKPIHIVPPFFVLTSLLLLIVGCVNMLFFKIFASMWFLYFIYLLVAALISSAQHKKFKYIIILPFAFITMQIAWGFGFLVGIFKTYK